ncbi:hypothetical protein NC796_15785 [Aliifodinibius sp. S!AR15-10]|uniref:hypothetical protein n=1 Tax=Aliifodinibius sp. S!AR15-10 TaxID=2950437 RepID=UPI002859EFDF|nr:hypothetical protein [Aliifodinibius sp. S!AR15-10]MDR8392617.1 hypothetical protein [Aliifodinibius sp. S!AR15-10]
MIDNTVTYSSQDQILGRSFIDGFFKIWALVLPVTSVLVFPSVQGTTPAYIMAFLSLPVILFSAQIREIRRYLFIVMLISIGYILLNVVSQFFLSLYGHLDLSSLPMVESLQFSDALLLRSTLFTQTLYLAASLMTFLFVWHWYRPEWDHYIFAGILLLVAYGFYEVVYYWLTGTSGDFLTNRVFNERHPGSLSQTIEISGIKTLRMKSLTGEASMFAFTVLPYWIYALHTKRYLIGAVLTGALLLSTSTTAILGMGLYGLILVFSGRINTKYLLAGGIAGTIAVAVKFQAFWGIFDQLILRKLSAESLSGITRFSNLYDCVTFWGDAPFPTKLFGLGFGYVRSTDFFSTILVNNGLVGLGILLLVFGYPVLALRESDKEFGLKCALVIIAFTMLASVPEYMYLPVWLFLGISYNYLNHRYAEPSQYLYRRGG